MLQTFYDENAFVRMGLLPNNDNIKIHMDLIGNYLEESYREGEKYIPMYVATGNMMNRVYGLTGEKAFVDNFSMIISPRNIFANYIRDGFDDVLELAGGIWFQDLVDGLMKEEEESIIVWSDEPLDG